MVWIFGGWRLRKSKWGIWVGAFEIGNSVGRALRSCKSGAQKTLEKGRIDLVIIHDGQGRAKATKR